MSRSRFRICPSPAVTAAEVVDRETLTTFVEEAATAFRAAYLTENFSGVSAVKNAFRAEGDWKSGSVYVWVVSDEGYVVFHGSEQHREGKRSNPEQGGHQRHPVRTGAHCHWRRWRRIRGVQLRQSCGGG